MKIKNRTLICEYCKKETKMNASNQKYCSKCNAIVGRIKDKGYRARGIK